MARFKYYLGLAVIGLIFLWLSTYLCRRLFLIKEGNVRVTVRYKAQKTEDLIIFWSEDNIFSPTEHLAYQTDTVEKDYIVDIRQAQLIARIRIDPAGSFSSATIYSVTLSGTKKPYTITRFDTLQTSGLTIERANKGYLLRREQESSNPYFTVNIPPESQSPLFKYSFQDILIIIACIVLTGIFILLLAKIKILHSILSTTPFTKQALFLGFILIISTYWTNSLAEYYTTPPSIENRALAQKPDPDTLFHNVTRYFEIFNNWFTDYFPFRQKLVHLNSIFKIYVFNVSPIPSEVIIGKDFQFFSANSLLQDDFIGKRTFSKEELIAIMNATEGKKQYLAEHHISFYLTMPPSKQDIYYSFMPDYYRLQECNCSLSQQVKDNLKHDSDNFYIDVIDTLYDYFKLHPEKKVFYQYDIHWSEWGAFKAYQVLIDRICKDYPECGRPLREDEIKIDTAYHTEGNLAKQLVMNKTLKQEVYFITPLKKDSIKETVLNYTFPPVYIYHNPSAKGRILVFRDSYSEQWKWLIAHHFNESIFIWDPKVNTTLIEKYKPDIVLQESCEMFIYYLFMPLDKGPHA